jgi:hypothetical protein
MGEAGWDSRDSYQNLNAVRVESLSDWWIGVLVDR